MKHRKSKFTLPKFNFLGIGAVYLFIYFPNVLAVKVGYTGVSIKNRAKSVSDDVFGWAIPIGFVIMPFAWHLEQGFHELLAGLKWDFYKGQGHLETFIFPAHIIMFPIVWYGMYLDYLAVKWVFVNYF